VDNAAAREERLPATELELGPWLLLLAGVLLAFFGRTLVVLQLAVLGALIGAMLAVGLVDQSLGSAPDSPFASAPTLWRLGALVVGAVVGWLLAGLVRRVAVFVIGAAIGGAAALGTLAQWWSGTIAPGVAWLIGAVVGGIALLVLEGPLLKLATAALGAFLVAGATSELFFASTSEIPLLIGLAVGVLGAAMQLAAR
jgi:hypothetical protein